MARSAAEWLAEGNAHYDARRWNEAGQGFERALALDPGTAGAWYRLGNVCEEQGRDVDAAACFERALALHPTHAQAWNNLGGARQRLGSLAQATDAFRRSIAADPALREPRLNLGRLLVACSEHALAAECFAAGLAQHPGDPVFEHLVAATHGKHTARAPSGYISQLFDGVAAQFEHHLVRALEYRVPEALAALVRPALLAAAPARALDLGCGTGLVGAALAGWGVELAGVDLSRRMLEVAAARGGYARLEQGDMVEALEREPGASLHAVFAADVFIYMGDLRAVFAAAERALAPGGVLAFSVEALDEGSYRLQPTGRYSHSVAYLRGLAAASGLREFRLERAILRREAGGPAMGWLALFARPG